MLTQRQLRQKQGAILDIAAHTTAERRHWQELAQSYGAAFYAIETICSDITLHRTRVQGRKRGIPGRHEINWSHVEQMRTAYEPWSSIRLTVDAVNPLDSNIQAILEYVH